MQMQAHELPPPVQMTQLLAGFQLSQALYVAAALGVADHLVAGPAPVTILTERTGAHAPSLHRLLRTLASEGVFTEPEPGVFALTPLGQTLATGQPGSMRDLAITWMETHYAPFGDLTHTIRTGQPAAEHVYGQPFFTWLAHHPEQATRFTAAMANVTSGLKTAAIASLPLDGIDTIVDLGGADGAVLAAILPTHPHMRGVLFDLPHVIDHAPKALAERGIGDRVDCVAGDFFASVPAGGDGYLLSLVLHDWPDPQALRILRNIAAASSSGARLLIIELVVPPGDTPHLSKMVDLTMLAMVGGKERSEPEWRELLTAAGFTGIAVRHTGTPYSVIHAVAP
jgi:O-methyltransferase domain/Dimerisation domain